MSCLLETPHPIMGDPLTLYGTMGIALQDVQQKALNCAIHRLLGMLSEPEKKKAPLFLSYINRPAKFLPLVDINSRILLGSGEAVSFWPGSEAHEFVCHQVKFY